MDKKIIVGIIIAVVIIIAGFMLFSKSSEENTSIKKFEGEKFEENSAKAFERTNKAIVNYENPDSYKLFFISYQETYFKSREIENENIIKISQSGYVDNKNRKAMLKAETYIKEYNEEGGSSEENNIETIILKDDKKYLIKDGKVIEVIDQPWIVLNEIGQIIDLARNGNVTEYSIVNENGQKYDVLKIMPTNDVLQKYSGGNFDGNIPDQVPGLDYKIYIETWLNRKTEMIEKATFYLNMNLNFAGQIVKTKINMTSIRTEVNKKIPDSMFDVPS